MPSAQQLGDDLRKLRTDQQATFDAGRKEDGSMDLPAEKVSEVRERNDAITKAAKAYEEQLTVEGWDQSNVDALKSVSARGKTRQADPANDSGRPAAKSLGEMFTESPQFKAWKPGMKSSDVFELDLEATYGKAVAAKGIKAVFNEVSTTGWAPQAMRLPDATIPGSETVSEPGIVASGRRSA